MLASKVFAFLDKLLRTFDQLLVYREHQRREDLNLEKK